MEFNFTNCIPSVIGSPIFVIFFVVLYMKKLAFLFIIISSLSYSQESDLGNWLIYIGSKKVNTKWNIHHEVQYRNYNAIGDLEQLLLRTGVGYNLSPKNKLGRSLG